MTNGKQKGARAELEVASTLERWWRIVEPQATIRRTPMSGGWSKDPAFSVSGDLVCSDDRFPFSVEVKKRENWSWESFFSGKPKAYRSPVWDWWKQCCNQSELVNKLPLLWFTKNRKPWMIMMFSVDCMKLNWNNGKAFFSDVLNPIDGDHTIVFEAEELLKTEPSKWIGMRSDGC